MNDMDTELDELFDTELEEYEQERSSCGCGCKGQSAQGELDEWQGETARNAPCPPPEVLLSCPKTAVPPFEVLDHFAFDVAHIDRVRHPPKIVRAARAMVASQRTAAPIRTVLVVGHTDKAGPDPYNQRLGERRADEVIRGLCTQLERMTPGLSRKITFQRASCGEDRRKATAAQSRRVEIFFPKASRVQPRPPYGDRCSASVPRRTLEVELGELEAPRQWPLKTTRPKATPSSTVEPILSLFLNDTKEVDREHFKRVAENQAKVVQAFTLENPKNCASRIGATPYNTGKDIIGAIVEARACLKRPIKMVHIFGHGTARGLAGRGDSTVGMYRSNGPPRFVDRSNGGRIVTDIPSAPLSDDVTFVLHSCRSAGYRDFDEKPLKVANLAKQLYQHLKASLKNPVVYGHWTRGCSGRNCEWREYSNANPNGKTLKTLQDITPEHNCKLDDLPKACR
ncbi:hypothetical protein LVJ94_21995 [Pendulispora rubella]|uniref:OmpA-like domain-containing protein n=1 Tax=Pendulispora rubella TaxID=2741070 RepID=A0ABZ2LGL8_9BACT